MQPAIRPTVALVLALGGAFLPGCSGGEEGARPNIIILTLDTLRADRVGAYGNVPAAGSPTPLADRLAAQGVVFERCFVPRGVTHPSLASLLTGKYPATHGLRRNGFPLDARHVPLPVLLRRAGYRTAGFAANLDQSRWPFWVRGFEVAEDGIEGRLLDEGYGQAHVFQRVWDERTVTKALRWIETLPLGDAAPIFLWVHLYDVHAPYTPERRWLEPYTVPGYDGPFRQPTVREGDADTDRITALIDAWTLGRASFTPADLEQVKAVYDAGVRGCDEKLARVAAALEGKGLLKNALVIYSSDHGDELCDHHDYFQHGNSIYDGTLHVPLIVSWPGEIAGGRRVAGLTQNLDLFPTLLQAAGLTPPADCEGVSLLPVLRGETGETGRSHVFAEWEDLIASASDGEWKYIHNPKGARPRSPPYSLVENAGFPYECHELYNVAVDPREQHDLFAKSHPRAISLLLWVERFLGQPEHRNALEPGGPADEELAALGYLGAARPQDRVLTIDCGDER